MAAHTIPAVWKTSAIIKSNVLGSILESQVESTHHVKSATADDASKERYSAHLGDILDSMSIKEAEKDKRRTMRVTNNGPTED